MRVIYRSASKRRLTSPPDSVTQEVLVRIKCVLTRLLQQLGSFRSSLCRLLFCELAWLFLLTLLLPLVGSLAVTLAVWRRWAVPWISYFLSDPKDCLDTSATFRRKDAGVDHLLVTLRGIPNREYILEQMSQLVSYRCCESEGWKLTRSLVCLIPGCWVWRQEDFRVEDHVTFCEEVWRGTPLNEQSLKYMVNELCGSVLPSSKPLWQIHVVPFVQSESRSSCHALLVRSHHLIAHLFRPEDFYWGEAGDKILREAVVNALSNQRQNVQKFDSEIEIQDFPFDYREIEQNVQKYNQSKVQNRPNVSNFDSEINLENDSFKQDVPNFNIEINQNVELKFKIKSVSKTVEDMLAIIIFLWKFPGILFREILFSRGFQSYTVMSIALLLWEIPALVFHEILCSIHNAAVMITTPELRNRRALSWSDPISLDLLTRIKEASGADSIEAVLYSCLAGALNHYTRITGSTNMKEDNLRSLQRIDGGFLGVFLPVGESCPRARLRKVQRSIQRGMEGNRLPVSHLLATYWNWLLPEPLARFFANLLAQRYPVLVENLKSEIPNFSDVRIQHWKIHQADVGLYLGVVHQSDHVSLCVMSDAWTVERPDLLASNFDRAALDLALSLGVRCERRVTPPNTPTKTTPPGTPIKAMPPKTPFPSS